MLSEKYKKLINELEEDYEWFKFMSEEYNAMLKYHFGHHPIYKSIFIYDSKEYDKIIFSLYPAYDAIRYNKIKIIFCIIDLKYDKYDIFKILRMYHHSMNMKFDKLKKIYDSITFKNLKYHFSNLYDIELMIHCIKHSENAKKIHYFELVDYSSELELLDD